MEDHRKLAIDANLGDPKFGVKKHSLVLNYDFDVINQTPQDIMHVLNEGVARRLPIMFFKIWIETKRCTISELNLRLSQFKYGYTHVKNRLKRISMNDVKKNSLIISAAQMHSLILLFPIIFVDIIDTSTEEYL